MSSSNNYHLPAIAVMAGIALAASSYVISNNSESKKRRRRIKSKLMKERDDNYVFGLENSGNSCFANPILQAMATLSCLRSYLAERVDEQGDEAGAQIPPDEFILQSVAFALYSTVELLNRPLRRPRSIAPTDFLRALEYKTQGTISRDQQDAHQLFQIISSILTSEEEIQYKQSTPSLLDVDTLRYLTVESVSHRFDAFESSSFSSMGTFGSMWSSFSVSTTGRILHRRPRRPRNPFTGLAASKLNCLNCGYTAPIRHHTFNNISLTVPQTVSQSANCTLESCLGDYTKTDILTDYQCRKCNLLSTMEKLEQELETIISGHNNSNSHEMENNQLVLMSQIDQLKHALQHSIENDLFDIPLTPPKTTACTSKQTMFANPPKSLCLHLSRSMYHPSGHVQFPEYLDLAPYTTNGYLTTKDQTRTMNNKPEPTTSPCQLRTSQANLVYLRNMAGCGDSIMYDQEEGLEALLPGRHYQSSDDSQAGNNNKPSMLPSLTIPTTRPIMYRLTAVIVRHGGEHESGTFITYRRKKLFTGQDARPPHTVLNNGGDYYHGSHRQYRSYQQQIKFWRCNNELVEEVDLDTVLSSAPYMLFYERE
ncbi:hypothetical protein BC941DRAFT_349512 [Chlamydoabsidia padenii]|nr:hypothetical protein BC941DRAFT_349512 [Chlamydoabsidia padenii]